ncbi:portal protein [Azospirillum sp. sgz301742]
MATDLVPAPSGGALAGQVHPMVDYAFKRFEREKTRWDRWVPLWTEAYDFGLPQRDAFYQGVAGIGMEGDKRGVELFDMTAVVSLSEFASRLHAGIMPPFVRWADLVPGTQIPAGMRPMLRAKLDEVADYVFEVLRDSNLDSQIHECFLDLGVGHASLLVEEGIDKPIEFLAVPMTHNIWGMGPKGQPDANFRIEKLSAEALGVRYPRALADPQARELIQGNPTQDHEVIHATWRMWQVREDTVHAYVCFLSQTNTVLQMHQYAGDGSYPYVNFRWAKAAGELYGRGPMMNALSAVKTANLIVRDMLDAAELATAGMWQADDDGVLNPSTVQIGPGVIVPVAPGSRGLQPLQPSSNLKWGDFLLEQLRADIKRALYDEMLGPPEGTPMSATEVRERQADMARRIGSPFQRIQVECVQPLLKRVIHILQRQGRIEIPQVNGRAVKIVAVSPLARAQEQESVRNIFAWLEMLAQHYGPEMMAIISNPDEVGRYSAEKMGIPEKVVRDSGQAQQIMAQMRAAQAGGP